MSFFRFLLLALLIYLAIHIVGKWLRSPPKKTEIHGQPKGNEPLDLKGKDVEDAHFEEIKE